MEVICSSVSAAAGRVRSSLRYETLRFELLRPSSVDEAREATCCPTTVMLFAHYGDPNTHWQRQAEVDALGDCLTLTVRDGKRMIGVCGLLPFRDGVRTATYLHPDARGGAVNQACKQVLWATAACAQLPLYATVRAGNERSLRAMAKTWPQARCDVVVEADRTLVVFALERPPVGGRPLSASERGALRSLVRATAFGQRHVVPARAPRVRRPRRAPELVDLKQAAVDLHATRSEVREAVQTVVDNAETWPVAETYQ